MSATMTTHSSDQLQRPSVSDILARTQIVPKLAPSTDGTPIPDGIIGATILGFGTVAWDDLCDHGDPIALGGLAIDYAPSDGSPIRRVVLGFSELGMWIEFFHASSDQQMPRPTQDGDQQ